MTGAAEGSAVQRAERFSLVLPVRYRRSGTESWAEGASVNISRTGLLFTTDPPTPSPGEWIDFMVRLAGPEGATGGEARCTGRVVRVVPASPEGEGAAEVGVTIDRYELAREHAALWAAVRL